MTSLQDSKLYELTARIPALANAANITALGGGLTNRNYRVDTATGTYVMRVSERKSSLLGIDRENEKVNMELAHRAGVGAAGESPGRAIPRRSFAARCRTAW